MVTFHQLMELDVNALETFSDSWNAVHRKIKDARTEFHDGGEVQKLYDWGIPSEHRSDVGGGQQMEQADIAHLNTVGLAQDFNVRGTSDEMTSYA